MKLVLIGCALAVSCSVLLYSVVITCNCPFKDPTACKWWCSIL